MKGKHNDTFSLCARFLSLLPLSLSFFLSSSLPRLLAFLAIYTRFVFNSRVGDLEGSDCTLRHRQYLRIRGRPAVSWRIRDTDIRRREMKRARSREYSHEEAIDLTVRTDTKVISIRHNATAADANRRTNSRHSHAICRYQSGGVRGRNHSIADPHAELRMAMLSSPWGGFWRLPTDVMFVRSVFV